MILNQVASVAEAVDGGDTSATDGTPLVYLQRVRMAVAKSALEDGHKSIEAISNQVGYEDVAFFRELFRRHVGINPKAYREKFGGR